MTTVQLNTVTRRVEVFSSARDEQARADIAALDASKADKAATIRTAASRAALKALSTSAHGLAFLHEAGREGAFVWDGSDVSTEVAADATESTYVASDDDASGATGAWVRRRKGPVNITEAGFSRDNDGASNASAWNNLLDYFALSGIKGGDLYIPVGEFLTDAILTAVDRLHIRGAGVGATRIKVADGSGNVHLLSVAHVDSFACEHLTLDHNGTALGATLSVHTLRINGVRRYYLNDLEIRNASHHGIVTIPDDTTNFDNELAHISNITGYNIGVGVGGHGDLVRVFYGAKNATINGIICDGASGHAVHVGRGAGAVSNVIVRNAASIGVLVNSEGALLSNVHVELDDVICDLFANRPAVGSTNRLFFASDTAIWYRDNGAAWQQIDGIPSGVRVDTRGTYDTANRIIMSNIKCRLAVTQNQPLPESGAVSRAISIGVSGTEPEVALLGDVIIEGPWRAGALLQANRIAWHGGSVEGVLGHGVQAARNDCTLVGVHVKDAGQVAGTWNSFELGTTAQRTKLLGCSSSGTGVTDAVNEPSGADFTQVIGFSDPDSRGIVLTGANSVIIDGTAAEVTFSPAGNIAATDVQAALEELDSEKQASDATLTSLASLGTAADKLAYTTGIDTWAEATITAFGRSLIDDADAAAARTTLDVPGLSTANTFPLTQTFGDGTGNTFVHVDGAAGSVADINLRSGTSARWTLRRHNGAESGSNAGSDLNIIRRNDAGGVLGTAMAIIRSSGETRMQGVYDNTTASAANVFVDSLGRLLRSTSVRALKRDVEPVEKSRATAALEVPGIWYRSLSPQDNPEWSWYGFAAEDVAAVDPRLAHWGYGDEDWEAIIGEYEDEGKIKTGVIGHRLKADAALKPVGVMYERFTVMHQEIMRQQQAEIADLVERIEAIEAKVNG